jgi:hypothetical protein
LAPQGLVNIIDCLRLGAFGFIIVIADSTGVRLFAFLAYLSSHFVASTILEYRCLRVFPGEMHLAQNLLLLGNRNSPSATEQNHGIAFSKSEGFLRRLFGMKTARLQKVFSARLKETSSSADGTLLLFPFAVAEATLHAWRS